MKKIILFIIFLVVIILAACACSQPSTTTAASLQQIAENFIKNDTTYLFDGMPETLELTDISFTSTGGTFTYEFDSCHAGYGDRTSQVLAEVITPHTAIIKVEDSKVTSAIMDDYWDMKNKGPLNEIEIALAPIEEVTVNFMESNPVQVGVYIRGGLPDGCTTFHDIVTTREGNTINIEVTTQRPKGAVCPAVYNTFEKNINMGTDFTVGTTYTLKVNDYKTTFTYY